MRMRIFKILSRRSRCYSLNYKQLYKAYSETPRTLGQTPKVFGNVEVFVKLSMDYIKRCYERCTYTAL